MTSRQNCKITLFLPASTDYYSTGFLTLQYLVGRAIINIQSANTNFDNLNFNMKKMAYQSYIKDNMLSVLQIWLPFFIMLSFIITALQITKGVTYEKEKRLKVSGCDVNKRKQSVGL